MRDLINIVENAQGANSIEGWHDIFMEWIRRHLDFHVKPKDVNSGYCYSWAYFMKLCFPQATIYDMNAYGGHAFIEIDGFNDALVDYRLIGHVAVLVDGVCWDADGRPKHEEEIESWGMLDYDDPDWAAVAQAAGVEWTEEAAMSAGIYELSEEEVLKASGTQHLVQMIGLLEQAKMS